MRRSRLVLLSVCLACSSVSSATDWLQFRGPTANGVTNDGGVPASWGADENVLWQTDIPGAGWSSSIVVRDKLFITTAITDGPQNSSSDYRWEILCLDAKTGKVLWNRTALEGKPRLETHRDNTYASETPVSDGQYVVAYFGMMGMFCYDLDGMIYLLDGRGGKATIVDSATGDIVTQGRIPDAGEFWASPWSNQGKIYCLDARGQTFVLQPGRTLDVVAKNALPVTDDVRFWSTPSLADGRLFIRSNKTLYAIGSK